MKLQSAMEYLTTYGWAILILAIILTALYGLGVFSLGTPTVQPGSCYVLRPNGPETTQFLSMGGTCTGILPEFTIDASSYSGNIMVNPSKSLFILPQNTGITITSWVKFEAPLGPNGQAVILNTELGSNGCGYSFKLENTSQPEHMAIGDGCSGCSPSCNAIHGTFTPTTGIWYFLAGTIAPGSPLTANLYVDSNEIGSANINVFGANTEWGKLEIINGWLNSNSIPDYVSNIQLYNRSLSSAAIKSLYAEGIGGAPVDLTHLAAWWPLNGDTKDYSGNGNNGAANDISYETEWQTGYS